MGGSGDAARAAPLVEAEAKAKAEAEVCQIGDHSTPPKAPHPEAPRHLVQSKTYSC